jgi:hypothetical protein
VQSAMSAVAKRELARQAAPRYWEARRRGKAMILAEFGAATGYTRKHANRLLPSPPSPTGPIRRPRQRRYGPAVTEALVVAWHAADRICAKRLVPFLPELVPSLQRHGHPVVDEATRAQLLALSSATADRLLRPARTPARGKSATRRGALLKHQVAVRTFAQWDEARPGFMEAGLVAHCGGAITGAYLHTLVLTDVVTASTECFALRHRTPTAVVFALDRGRQLLPFPLLGFDPDNGGEFLNAERRASTADPAVLRSIRQAQDHLHHPFGAGPDLPGLLLIVARSGDAARRDGRTIEWSLDSSLDGPGTIPCR